MEVKDQRQHDSIFVYEFGALFTIVIILFWIFGYKLGGEVTQSLIITLIVLGILTGLHFLYLLTALGIRAKLSVKRLIIISLICISLFPLLALSAEIAVLPIILLPVLVILSPLFYLARSVFRRFRKPEKVK